MNLNLWNTIKTLGLIIIGGYFGSILYKIVNRLEHKPVLSTNWAVFIAETFYYTLLFSIPLSGSFPLLLINGAILAFAITHKFTSKSVPEERPEDKVVYKWFPGYP